MRSPRGSRLGTGPNKGDQQTRGALPLSDKDRQALKKKPADLTLVEQFVVWRAKRKVKAWLGSPAGRSYMEKVTQIAAGKVTHIGVVGSLMTGLGAIATDFAMNPCHDVGCWMALGQKVFALLVACGLIRALRSALKAKTGV